MVHVFSTVVHSASARGLAARKFSSTGGTDIDCVLKHILELPPRKRPCAAVVVTDGFTGKPDAALAERFRAAGMRLFVGLVKSDSGYNQEPDLSSLARRERVLAGYFFGALAFVKEGKFTASRSFSLTCPGLQSIHI